MPRKLSVTLSVVDQATNALAKAEGQFKRFGNNVKRSFKTLVNLPSILAGMAVFRLGKSFIDAASKVEVFRKQLIAITGSAAEADKKLAAIREFARTSPLETEDVVQSFVRLRAVGIDPTMDQMRTLGGVAVLFNKEMTEVLDSFIGLNKRTLRRLGVEIDRTGAQAVIASGNVKRVVSKDSASIRKALLEVWAERFPNAIETASDTFAAKMAILRSNIFEFQAQLMEEFMPSIKSMVDSASTGFADLIKRIRQIRVGILVVVAVVRTLWNGIQIAVDGIVWAFFNLYRVARFVLTAVMHGWMDLLEPIRVVAESIGSILGRIGGAAKALWNRDWKELGRIVKAGWDDILGNIDEAQDRIHSRMLDTDNEWNEFTATAQGTSKLLAERTSKNMDDIANSMYAVAEAVQKIDQEVKKVDLGGTGATGADLGMMKGIKQKIKLIREEIKVIKERIKANRFYEELILAGIKDAATKRLMEIDQSYRDEVDKIQKWERTKIVTAERAEEMRTAAARKAALERQRIAQEETEFKINMAVRSVNALTSLAKTALENSRANAKQQRNILYALAIANSAAAAVQGIYEVWRDESIGSVYGKIAMTVVVAGEIIAAAAAEISSIKSASFARGTSFAPGGAAVVGEEGPEAVMLPRGSQVMTAAQTRQTIGPMTVSPTIIIQGNADSATVGKMENALANFAKNYRESVRLGYLAV